MKNKKIKVGLIFGGRSAEHQVSLVSARSVMEALNKDKYEIIPIGITESGKWLVFNEAMNLLEGGPADAESFSIIPADPTHNDLMSIGERNGLVATHQSSLDVIFPVLHGTFGEDGSIQGFLELTDIPYVGCGVLASALGMDKAVQKSLFIQKGLPVVNHLVIRTDQWQVNQRETIRLVKEKLTYPIFVKPANLGSSVGISKVSSEDKLEPAVNLAFQYDQKILVEQAVSQARELECAILGNDQPQASLIGEIVPNGEFYDYRAKYLDGQSQLIIPAKISDEQAQVIQEISISAFKTIDGAGMARVDFLLDGKTGKLFLSEVNTIPGFTPISMYPKLWQASGLTYSELIDQLIELALERHNQKSKLKRKR